MFGLKDIYMTYIIDACEQVASIDKVFIFGSRALGNYKSGSDIDLVVYGANVTEKDMIKFNMILNEEMPIPFFIDTVYFESINNDKLIEHINSVGKAVFEKSA